MFLPGWTERPGQSDWGIQSVENIDKTEVFTTRDVFFLILATIPLQNTATGCSKRKSWLGLLRGHRGDFASCCAEASSPSNFSWRKPSEAFLQTCFRNRPGSVIQDFVCRTRSTCCGTGTTGNGRLLRPQDRRSLPIYGEPEGSSGSRLDQGPS
jgi:hypothetical protein